MPRGSRIRAKKIRARMELTGESFHVAAQVVDKEWEKEQEGKDDKGNQRS